MSEDFEREEAAFRAAFTARAGEAASEPPGRVRRSRRWVPLVAAAAVLVAVVGTAVVLDRDSGEGRPSGDAASTYWDRHDWHWISYGDVEVKAPEGWRPTYEVSRPDCIGLGGADDIWARGVPAAPYVTTGTPPFGVALIGCIRTRHDDDPAPGFGQLPFRLWQPYVKMDRARPDLSKDDPARADATLEYRGWRLTRTTVGAVQITVLSRPGDDDLGAGVIGSLRRVRTNSLGCAVESPVTDAYGSPSGPVLPDPADVTSVSICEYGKGEGLRASRRIPTESARSAVAAIRDAPAGSGPNSPSSCLHDFWNRALVLNVYGPAKSPVAQAYVYFDNCTGNGVVDASGTHQLTRANCYPLFDEPPIGFGGGSRDIIQACGSLRISQ